MNEKEIQMYENARKQDTTKCSNCGGETIYIGDESFWITSTQAVAVSRYVCTKCGVIIVSLSDLITYMQEIRRLESENNHEN